MRLSDFNQYYASTMMYYQIMENNIKLIYSYMLEGNSNNNYEDIENKTLGTMVRQLEELDYSDNHPYISRGDYAFLKQICDKRNYWAHKAFCDFVYIKNFENSREFKEICDLLNRDYNEVKRASTILEKMRIEFCSKYN